MQVRVCRLYFFMVAACVQERISATTEYDVVSFGPFIWLRRQLCSGSGVSGLWERRVDWQAALIRIDVATRCVSALWLLISLGTRRRPQLPPCCYHRSKMGVTMIKSALKHSLCVVCICLCATWRVRSKVRVCVCGSARVGVHGSLTIQTVLQ